MSEKKENNGEGLPPLNDNFSVMPNVRPFTKYRAIEMAVCGVCILLGILYLYAKAHPGSTFPAFRYCPR